MNQLKQNGLGIILHQGSGGGTEQAWAHLYNVTSVGSIYGRTGPLLLVSSGAMQNWVSTPTDKLPKV